jgi:hypothetical protein
MRLRIVSRMSGASMRRASSGRCGETQDILGFGSWYVHGLIRLRFLVCDMLMLRTGRQLGLGKVLLANPGAADQGPGSWLESGQVSERAHVSSSGGETEDERSRKLDLLAKNSLIVPAPEDQSMLSLCNFHREEGRACFTDGRRLVTSRRRACSSHDTTAVRSL